MSSDGDYCRESNFSSDLDHDTNYDDFDFLEDNSQESLPMKMDSETVTPNDRDTNLVEVEQAILDLAATTVEKSFEDVEFNDLESTDTMLTVWKNMQISDKKTFIPNYINSVSNLDVNNTIPIYLREQNCTILLTKLEGDVIQVETYRPSLPNQMVMSSVGSLSMAFPETRELVLNKELLMSETFAKAVYELGTTPFPISRSKKAKGGHAYEDNRDAPNPFLVSDFLVSLLVPVGVIEANDRFHPKPSQVTKTIRDQVNYANSAKSLPFRRSGMWMSIKVALHLKLLTDLDDDAQNAKLVYKIILLRLLTTVCQQYLDRGISPNLDLASQLMAKVGGRVMKLQKLECNPVADGSIKLKIERMRTSCLEFVHKVITDLRNTTNTLWMEVSKPQVEDTQKFERTKLEYIQDLHHTIPPLDNCIAEIKSFNTMKNVKPVNRATSTILQQSIHDLSYEQFKSFPSDDVKAQRIWLLKFETYIKESNLSNVSPSDIFDMILRYVSNAIEIYEAENNPIGFSQLVLVVLKAIEILDKVSTRKYPLLCTYKSGIDAELFHFLLLPHITDVQLLQDLLEYFNSRDGVAHYPSILSSDDVSDDTFAARYASQNPEMQQLKKQILADADRKIEQKFKELADTRKECLELQQQINAKQCKCVDSDSQKTTCARCMFETKLQETRRSVNVYKRPLPPDAKAGWRDAVVFELRIPIEISVVRDLLAILNFEILQQPKFQNTAYGMKWMEYRKLRPYQRFTMLDRGRGELMVYLKSITRPSSFTHHQLIQPFDLLSTSDEDFIVENGLDCFLGFTARSHECTIGNIKQKCTFQISCCDDSSSYDNLQQFLNNTCHAQNEVIASQHRCHANLALEEYIAFGSLRAGHRIQPRNMYRSICNGTLSLDKEPVLALILQSLWEVGSQNDQGQLENQLELENTNFCFEFLEMLERVVKSNETNYTKPMIIMAVIAIAIRIFNVNLNCEAKCYKVLKTCRNILETWIPKIEEEITKNEVEAGLKSNSKIKFYKETLLAITMCSIFSFNISHKDRLQALVQDYDDLVHWFSALSHLYDLTEVETAHNGMSFFSTCLLSIVKNVSLRLNIKRQITHSRGLSFKTSLQMFMSKKCCTYETIDVKTNENDPVVFGQYKENGQIHYIIFDISTGRFLVNGSFQSDLPSEIFQDKLFQMYFQKSKFRVQKYSNESKRTVNTFHGYHYMFRIHNVYQITIYELHDGYSLQLLDSDLLQGYVSGMFLKNYTHWLHSEENKIYFRRIPTQPSDYELPHDLILFKDPGSNSWKLFDEVRKQKIVSIRSHGFKKISQVLSKLELPKHVKVTIEDATNEVFVTLPRHNPQLNFKLVGQSVTSVEYPDYRISSNQCSAGTLVNLRQGLLLNNMSTDKQTLVKQMIIVPHGHVKIEGNTNDNDIHHQTEIDLKTLRQPSWFVYKFDPVLKCLEADKSIPACVYLALLHGATSSALPDPFTGITGTEAAVRILQSGFVWSCAPYDAESKSILREIVKKLSPKRSFHGGSTSGPKNSPDSQSLEATEWPEDLPSMAAYDGFDIIINKLFQDSTNLAPLFSSGTKQETKANVNKLVMRSYLRHLPRYNPIAAVNVSYFTPEALSLFNPQNQKEELELPMRRHSPEDKLDLHNLSQICHIRLLKNFEIQNILGKHNLVSFLITSNPLASADSVTIGNNLLDLFCLDLRSNWLKIYNLAVTAKSDVEKRNLSLILSALAYRGEPINQIMFLHHISVSSSDTDFPLPPAIPSNLTLKSPSSSVRSPTRSFYQSYPNPSEHTYNPTAITEILKRHVTPFVPVIPPDVERTRYEYSMEFLTAKRSHQTKAESDAANISIKLKKYWPCESIPQDDYVNEAFADTLVTLSTGLQTVNAKLKEWYANYQLKCFVDKVQQMGNAAKPKIKDEQEIEKNYNFKQLDSTFSWVSIKDSELKQVRFEDFLDASKSTENVEDIRNIFHSGQYNNAITENGDIKAERELVQCKINVLSQQLVEMFTDDETKKLMFLSGLMPRTDPVTLLQYLMKNFKHPSKQVITAYTGSLAVLYCHLKRLNRCLILEGKGQDFASGLKRELGNKGHVNWSPTENPEWLMLQLQLDCMIRPVQVDVANQMLVTPNGGNGVMQLNMGEGKTSVIVPMLSSTIADTKLLCRVTVLNSIFKTNFTILSWAIGGLLNRRVYQFPCRRYKANKAIDKECAQRIMAAYQECMEQQGVVLTLPEYRLSFRLLAMDVILKKTKDVQLGSSLLEIENWLREHARDIMDESDELLNVKYQLVYTIGDQISIDGGNMRWVTCQKILRIVQNVAGKFIDEFGPSVLEFDKQMCEKNPHQFSPIRILDAEAIMPTFLSTVADEYLKELMLPQSQKELVKRFLVSDELPREQLFQFMEQFKTEPDTFNKILLVSGYLSRGVLGLALSKRRRVEYGVDLTGAFKMAVPFRAKDVAAEKTEFGHPDVAILLTYLSYYSSGLSDTQLSETFDILGAKPGPHSIYSSWLHCVPKSHNVPEYLLDYKGVNLKDLTHRSTLFDLLRRHVSVIDFWLSTAVFPKESKQFPGKMVMTAWDLCYERQKNLATGFSGTNNSSMLLPLTISEQDLPCLLETNVTMEQTLLRPENGHHRGLQVGATCRQILEQMTKDKLQVLIDAGALMLECDNEQVAQLWLQVDLDIEAVVYFNKDNDILVKCRSDLNGGSKTRRVTDNQLAVSPYQGRLDKCGVYLDDQHTRGTDLKFPIGSIACVTIGSRMRRDKLIQACMRMRKLGAGHSVSFYLSHEAHDKVMRKTHSEGVIGVEVTTQNVLNWVNQNTQQFNKDGLVFWACAGKNYAQKLAAEDNFHFPHDLAPYQSELNVPMTSQDKIEKLANQCLDDEIFKLEGMYGQFSHRELLTNLIPKWFHLTKLKLQKKNRDEELPPRVVDRMDEICNSIVSQCLKYAPNKTYLANTMEEEQEKELGKETEFEDERRVERPKKVTPATPSLHKNVINTVIYPQPISVQAGIVRVSDIFQNTTFWGEVQPSCWGQEVFATQDFVTVFQSGLLQKTDLHLRPIEYLVSRQLPNGCWQILILSPYEVNRLLPLFRQYKTDSTLHMFSPRRLERQDLLVNNRRLQLPSLSLEVEVNIPKDCQALMALLLASGNLYFESMEEQRAFAKFLGKVPQPWVNSEAIAFKKGMITKTGFLLPEFRSEGVEQVAISFEAFYSDPLSLVKKILFCRHPVVNEVAHVIKLLDENVLVAMQLK